MALKQILVVLDTSRNCAGRLDLALELAREHGARVTGLHVVVHRFFEPSAGHEAEAAELAGLFAQKSAHAGISGEFVDVDCATVGVAAADVVSERAQYADLVVVGQATGTEERLPADLPEQVVLKSVRPVLIVPYAGKFTQIGSRVMLAWKSGRESARCVADALPLLAKAKEVRVLEVVAPDGKEDGAAALVDYLGCHGVSAHPERIPLSQVGIADAILNRVPVEGIDLLVMGAYGHNRSGAPVLGEVAREMLQHMTVPVLMSH